MSDKNAVFKTLDKELYKKGDSLVNGKGDFRVAYSTGFPTIDRFTKRIVKLPGNKEMVTSGILTGAYGVISGESQTGKTTLAMNIAANIIKGDIHKAGLKNYDNSWIEYFSPEGGMELDRLCDITGIEFNEAFENNKIRITPIEKANTEQFELLIENLYKMKVENPDIFLYDAQDIMGNPTKEFVPTVVVVDSLTMLFPKDLKDLDNEAKNTIYAHQNNKNGVALMRCLEYCRNANIIVIFITHVSEKLSIDGRQPKRKFKAIQGKTNITGGQKLFFTSDWGLYLDKYPSGDLNDLLKNDSVAYAVNAICFKNRMGMDGEEAVLVNSGERGFSPLYSLIYESIHKDSYHTFLKPAGSMYKMEKYEKSFYKKDIYNLFLTDETFRTTFMNNYKESLENHSKSLQSNLSDIQDEESKIFAALSI